MPTDTAFGVVRVFDDFVLDTGALWHTSADGTGSTDVVADGTAHLSGRMRLTSDATDNQLNEVATGLCFRVQDGGPLIMEARIMQETGTIATSAFNVGFNDDPTDASNTLPVELATVTFTSNASTFVGFVCDGDATNVQWHAFWVDDDTDTSTAIADLRMTGEAPVADTWTTLRVVLSDRGSGNGARADFFVDGKLTKSFDTTVDRDAVLAAYVGGERRSASQGILDVDYIYVCGGRTDA